MANHSLPVKEYAKHMRTLKRWHSVAHVSGGTRKSLDVAIGRHEFRVTRNDRTVYRGKSAIKAVEKYNSIYA